MLPLAHPKQSSWMSLLNPFIVLILLGIIRPCMAWVPTTITSSHLQQESSSAAAAFPALSFQSGRIWAFSTPPLSSIRLTSSPLYATSDDDSNPTNDDDNDETRSGEEDENNQDEDAAFYREYEKAKLDKLGCDLPSDQLKASAESAESEFLKAMQECQSDYETAQEEAADDHDDGDALSKADFFLEQIKKEEALEELWNKQQAEGAEEGEEEIEESEKQDEDYFQ
jgi:hypothetical protein